MVTMAVGGALTWHWVFIVGEGVMLLGAALFLGAVAISAWRLDGRSLQERATEWLEGLPEPDEPAEL